MSGARRQCDVVHIRWMVRRDMPECLAIEKGSFDDPWCEEDFLVCLRQAKCIGMVTEYRDKIIGYMLYELEKHILRVRNFAVSPEHRHQGVGREMVAKLVNKLSQQRRQEIVLAIAESNLDAQLFFRTMGFRSVEVSRQHFDNLEDAYLFSYVLPLSECNEPRYSPRNRIAGFV